MRRNNGGNYLATRAGSIKNGVVRKTHYMHRDIIGDTQGMDMDHINGNGLDNRKINLRECSHMENRQNSKIYRGRKFKGVKKNGSGFSVRLVINKKEKYFGTYPTEREAAWLYNKLAAMYFGEFARLNRIPQ